jgi:hypothetical protein
MSSPLSAHAPLLMPTLLPLSATAGPSSTRLIYTILTSVGSRAPRATRHHFRPRVGGRLLASAPSFLQRAVVVHEEHRLSRREEGLQLVVQR